MSSTTTKGRHAAEWTVLRVIKDRAYKFTTPEDECLECSQEISRLKKARK